MKISITEKEYDAIHFGLSQIESAMEAASDEEYIKSANEACDHLYSIIGKYQKARMQANELNDARSLVRSHNGWMPQAEVDKIARKIMKRTRGQRLRLKHFSRDGNEQV